MLKNTFTHWIGGCLLSLLLALPVFSQTISNVTFSPSSICAGGTIEVAFDTADFTVATNKFAIELSDATGNFASKRVLNANASLTNTITLPTDLVGTGFKIRVTTSSPVVETVATGVLVVKATPPAPVSTAGFGLGVCQGEPPLDLGRYVTGSNLKWYSYTELWAPIDTVVAQSVSYVPNSTPSSTSPRVTRYRITQTVDGCESTSYASINSVSTSYPIVRPDALTSEEKSKQVCLGEANVSFPKSGDWQTSEGVAIEEGSFIPTDKAGTFIYTRKRIINCEKPGDTRDTLTITVQATSAAPVTATTELCPSSTAPDIATLVTATNGATLKWYSSVSSATAITKPTITTTTVGDYTYYVSQTEIGKCESARTAITIRVKRPDAPVVTSLTACKDNVLTALTATGTNLKWYAAATGGAGTATAPTPSNKVSGKYYVSQTVNGCESPRAEIVVTITEATIPTLTSATKEYCLNATSDVLPQATGRVWYTAKTGGSLLAADFKPLTTAAGSTSYWAANKVGTCESERVEYKIIVTSVDAPVLTESIQNYCKDTPATAVTVLPQATGRVWYTAKTGGSVVAATFKPATSTAGSTSYWAANKVGTCESERVEYKVVIIATPAPVVANLQACAGETLQPLTATGTDLKWYTASTGGTASATAPTPSNTASRSYFVSQTLNGCESPRAEIKVTINPIPVAPVVANLATVCQDQTVASTALTSAVTKANSAAVLKWYDSLLDTTGVTTTPTISTAKDGLQEFVVTQTILGCESPKSTVKLEVKVLPAAPKVVEAIDYCHNEKGAVALTAEKSPTNTTLKWYTVATGGSASAIAPIPATTVVGNKSYWVSQTHTYTVENNKPLACESKRSTITVVTNALPASVTTKDIVECQTKEATPITLTAEHATGNSLKWYESNTATTALLGNPIVDKSKVFKGSYFVTQVNAKNCESAARKELKVNIKLLPGAPQVVTLDKCQFDTPEPLTAGSVAGASLKWWGSNATGGTSSANAPTPEFVKGESSHYYVSQILEGCESDRAKLDVIVKTTPKPTVTQNTFVYCQNAQSSVLTAQGQRLTWYFGTLSGPEAFAPPTTNIGTVNYYVAQTGDNGCISPKEEIKVTVNPKPSAAITGSTKIELGQVAELVINFTGGGPWSYVLSDNTEGTTETTPLIIKKSPQKTTTYSIKEVSNVCGLGTPNGSALVEVLVPAINTGNPGVASLCANQKFTIPFQASAISVPQFEYKLQISKDTVDAHFVSIPTTIAGSNATGTIPGATEGGDYYIRLIVESPQYEQPVKGTISQVVLTVKPLPVATISGSKTILVGESAVVQVDFSGTGPWHYMMGDETELTTTSNSTIYKTVQPATTTTYTVKEVQNECGVGLVKGEARIQVDPILANEPVIVAGDWLQVFPVPVATHLTVQVKEAFVKGTIVVTVTDAAGRVVKKTTTMNRISEVDFSQLAGGMYFVRVENGELVSVTKVTKY